MIGVVIVVGCVGMIIFAIVLSLMINENDKKRKQKEKEEATKRWNSLSKEEQEEEQKAASIKASVFIYSLPEYCPSCFSSNYEGSSTGFATCKWILTSTETKEKERFDGATRIMGATTIHTTKYEETIKTYKCPNCGYIIKK